MNTVPRSQKRVASSHQRRDVIRRILQAEIPGQVTTLRQLRAADPALQDSATRHFGRWSDALRAAGLDPEAVSGRRRWTADRLVQAIRELARRGVPLNYKAVYETDPRLPQAAAKHFGSWDEALRASGFDPQTTRRVRRPWTRAEIIGLIRQRWASNLPVNSHGMVPKSLPQRSRRFFNSWSAALRAAGIPDALPRWPLWSKPAVLEAILLRLHAGQALNTAVVCRDAKPLYGAARHHFGSWAEALRAADIDSDAVRRHRCPWTPQGVLLELQSRRQSGLELNPPARCSAALVRAAKRFFGSWRKAIEAVERNRP